MSTDISDYKSEIKIFQNSKIDVREYTQKFRKRKEHTLILMMSDHSTWKFSEQYSEYWKVLGDKNNKGKKFKFYISATTVKNSNPPRVEIEDKIVYDLNEVHLYKYLILGLTLILLFMSYKRLTT